MFGNVLPKSRSMLSPTRNSRGVRAWAPTCKGTGIKGIIIIEPIRTKSGQPSYYVFSDPVPASSWEELTQPSLAFQQYMRMPKQLTKTLDRKKLPVPGSGDQKIVAQCTQGTVEPHACRSLAHMWMAKPDDLSGCASIQLSWTWIRALGRKLSSTNQVQ